MSHIGLFARKRSKKPSWEMSRVSAPRNLPASVPSAVVVLVAVLFAALAVAGQIARASVDPETTALVPIKMNRVAVIGTPAFLLLSAPGGWDFDHDGQRELVIQVDDDEDPLEFYECTGDNEFALVHVLNLEVLTDNDSFQPADAGDTDGDGLVEIVIRAKELLGDGSGNAEFGERIYESLTVDSFPTELTWSGVSPVPGWTFGGRIVDGDGDGKQKIAAIHMNGTEFVVFENDGNDSYVQTHSEIIPEPVSAGQSFGVTSDLDMDGKDEVLFGFPDRIYAFESSGEDYQVIWTWDFEQFVNVMFLVDAGDLDGDGLREFLTGGLEPNGGSRKLYVFESVGNDAVEIVATLVRPAGAIGFSSAAVADVDGNGTREIVFGTPSTMTVYGNAGDNAWEEIWTVATGGFSVSVGAGDHDEDGKDEVIFRSGGATNGTTSVWEIDPADQADMDGDDWVDVIDNCPLDFNPGQDDIDADTVGDACDNCIHGPNPAQGMAPLGQEIAATSKDAFSWSEPADILWIQGDLAAVALYDVGLLDASKLATSFTDLTVPPSNAGLFYLVRPDCAVGSWQTILGDEPARDATLP